MMMLDNFCDIRGKVDSEINEDNADERLLELATMLASRIQTGSRSRCSAESSTTTPHAIA